MRKPSVAGVALADAEVGERLAQIEIGLAGGDDAEPRRLGCRARCGRAGWRVRRRRPPPSSDRTAAAPVRAADRASGCSTRPAAFRNRTAAPPARAKDRCRSTPNSRPSPAIALKPTQQPEKRDSAKPQEPEIEIILQRCRIEDRHQRRREDLFALVRKRRGLAAMIVAGERQHAAMPRGAGRIGVLQHVDRTVDAGALAVPDAEHAIDLGAGKQSDLLAAPHGGRRQVLVQAGNKGDVVRCKETTWRATGRCRTCRAASRGSRR